MIFNLVFLLCIILYTIYSYIKGSANTFVNLLVGVISLIIASLLDNTVAMLLSKYATFMDMDETTSVLLGSEYVYFKTIAFLLIYTISVVVFAKVFKRLESVELLNSDNKLLRVSAAFVVACFHMTILLSVALATPYALKYSNNLSSAISNVVGVGTVMNTVTYDYNDFNDILKKNPNLTPDEINIVVMEEMIKDGYGSKKSFRSVLSKSHWYTDKVDKWLKK